jgi:hypothetical protein
VAESEEELSLGELAAAVGAQGIAIAPSRRQRPRTEGPNSALRGSLGTCFARHRHGSDLRGRFNPSARFCAESTDMLDMRLSRYCDGCENEEINSPSGQRNWAPCRLRRPRSVAVTRRAAPRGDQICFPAKGPRALHPRPALESQSTDGTRFDSRQLPLLLPYGASRSRRRELLEIAVVRVQGAKARAVHSNAEHDLDDSGLVDDSWRHGQDGNFSVY